LKSPKEPNPKAVIVIDRKLLLSFREAAEYLGVPINTLRHWTSAGKVKKVEGTSYISRSEIERFVTANSQPMQAERRRRGRYGRNRPQRTVDKGRNN